MTHETDTKAVPRCHVTQESSRGADNLRSCYFMSPGERAWNSRYCTTFMESVCQDALYPGLDVIVTTIKLLRAFPQVKIHTRPLVIDFLAHHSRIKLQCYSVQISYEMTLRPGAYHPHQRPTER